MKERLKKFDQIFARGEAAIATFVLLSLILVAAVQTFLRKFADFGSDWAAEALTGFHWGDPFMERATVWLAMLGASLATYHNKQIAIDVLQRVVNPIWRAIIRGSVQLFAGVTCFLFSRVVLQALLSKSARIATDYGTFNEIGDTIHICVAPAEAIPDGMDVPSVFCAVRGALESIGVTVNSPERALDLIVPTMFMVLSVRFILKALGDFLTIPEGGIPDEEMEDAQGDPTALDSEEEIATRQAVKRIGKDAQGATAQEGEEA